MEQAREGQMSASNIGAIGIAATLVAFASTDAYAGTRIVTARLEPSRYVSSDNPACGVKGPLTRLKDPEVVAAVTAVNTTAGAVVFVVGTGVEIAESSGGDIAKFIRQANGPDYASCADMCVVSPPNQDVTKIEWSDRDGGYGNVSLSKARAGISNKNQKDWSGWRNFIAFKNADSWWVCGTGTNWSHNQRATKRIRITYGK